MEDVGTKLPSLKVVSGVDSWAEWIRSQSVSVTQTKTFVSFLYFPAITLQTPIFALTLCYFFTKHHAKKRRISFDTIYLFHTYYLLENSDLKQSKFYFCIWKLTLLIESTTSIVREYLLFLNWIKNSVVILIKAFVTPHSMKDNICLKEVPPAYLLTSSIKKASDIKCTTFWVT